METNGFCLFVPIMMSFILKGFRKTLSELLFSLEATNKQRDLKKAFSDEPYHHQKTGFVQVMDNLESHEIYDFNFQAWKVMEF